MGFVGTLERERKVSLCRDERSDMGGYGLGFAVFLLFFRAWECGAAVCD